MDRIRASYELSRFSIPYRMPLRTRRPCDHWLSTGEGDQQGEPRDRRRQIWAGSWSSSTGDDTTGFQRAPRKTPVATCFASAQFLGGFSNRGALFIPRVGDESDGWNTRMAIPIGRSSWARSITGRPRNPGNLVSLSLPEKKDYERRTRKVIHGTEARRSTTRTPGGSTMQRAANSFLVRARKDLYFSRL